MHHENGFASKDIRLSTSALPPDVRQWLCPAVSNQIIPGLPLVWA